MTHWQNFFHDATAEELDEATDSLRASYWRLRNNFL